MMCVKLQAVFVELLAGYWPWRLTVIALWHLPPVLLVDSQQRHLHLANFTIENLILCNSNVVPLLRLLGPECKLSQWGFYIAYVNDMGIVIKWVKVKVIFSWIMKLIFRSMYTYIILFQCLYRAYFVILYCDQQMHTIISQIITLLHVSTLSCHPQAACNQ